MKAYDVKIHETVGQLKQDKVYNMVFDGKDFVALPSGNRKQRRNKSANQAISKTISKTVYSFGAKCSSLNNIKRSK